MNLSRAADSPTSFSSLSHSFRLASLAHPIGLIAFPRILHQQDGCRKQRGKRPPQTEADFPNQYRNAGALAEPREEPPDVRRAGNPESPRERAGEPQRPALRRLLAQFLGAQAHAKLCATGKPTGEGNRRRAHRAQRFTRLARELGATSAILQMCGEPIALGLRDAFDALLRDQLFGASVRFRVHAVPPWSAPRSASRPRYRRDFTVESGMLSTPAISSICNSSWKRSTRTSR